MGLLANGKALLPACGAGRQWLTLFRHTAGDMPYADAGVTVAVCACNEAGAVVRLLRSQGAMKIGAQRFNVLGWSGTGSSWPAAAVAALTAAPVDFGTLSFAVSGESTPTVGRSGNAHRGLYGDGGRLYRFSSDDDGVTWATPVLAWNGSATYNRLSNFAGAIGTTRRFWVFNAYTPGGVSCVRGLNSASYSTIWPELPDGDGVGWQVAGLAVGGPLEPEPCLYVYLVGVVGGYSVLACQRIKLNGDSSFNSWDGAPQVFATAGAGHAYGCASFGFGTDGAWVTYKDGAAWFAARPSGAAPFYTGLGAPVELVGAGSNPATAEYLNPISIASRDWLIGAGEVRKYV